MIFPFQFKSNATFPDQLFLASMPLKCCTFSILFYERFLLRKKSCVKLSNSFQFSFFHLCSFFFEIVTCFWRGWFSRFLRGDAGAWRRVYLDIDGLLSLEALVKHQLFTLITFLLHFLEPMILTQCLWLCILCFSKFLQKVP